MMNPLFPSISLGMSKEICFSTLDLCCQCWKPNATMKCSACKCSRYCSRECQKKDWERRHKEGCSHVKDLDFPSWIEEATETEEGDPIDDFRSFLYSESNRSPEDCHKLGEAFDLWVGKKGVLEKRNKVICSPEEPKRHFCIDLPEGPEDRDKAKQLFRELAEKGDAAAMIAYKGFIQDVPGTSDEVLAWIQKAAAKGHADAQFCYGYDYWWQGKNGHKIDFVQALLWLRRALAHILGEYLQTSKVLHTFELVETLGRMVYLAYFPLYMCSEDDDVGANNAIKLAAISGHFPSIQLLARNPSW